MFCLHIFIVLSTRTPQLKTVKNILYADNVIYILLTFKCAFEVIYDMDEMLLVRSKSWSRPYLGF